jgi:hypothetical protein
MKASDDVSCQFGTHPQRRNFVPPPQEIIENAANMLRAAGDVGRPRLLLRL